MSINQTPAPGEAVTSLLVGWGDFDTLAETIHMRLFGHLVRLAAPVVVEHHGDLFIDAQTIAEEVNGPCRFDFFVRHLGTHLYMWRDNSPSDMVEPIRSARSDGLVHYRITLTCDSRQEWHLSIHNVVL